MGHDRVALHSPARHSKVMKCPFCNHPESKVVDSRESKDKETIRRRRECLGCQKRFTTSERAEEALPSVIKKDGRREPFNRLKILNGLKKACEKRPISINMIEKIVNRIELHFQEEGRGRSGARRSGRG